MPSAFWMILAARSGSSQLIACLREKVGGEFAGSRMPRHALQFGRWCGFQTRGYRSSG
jgi:hypothetical protein